MITPSFIARHKTKEHNTIPKYEKKYFFLSMNSIPIIPYGNIKKIGGNTHKLKTKTGK